MPLRPLVQSVASRTLTPSVPPSGMAWMALPMRLRKTCRSSTGNPVHDAREAKYFLRSAMRLACERAVLQLEHVIQQFRELNGNGLLRFAVEAEGLAGDVADALQFLFGHVGIVARLVVERGMIAQQIKECW